MTSFLVDQQLPKALATFLSERGHDARHIKEYEGGTTMPDPEIAVLADSEDRFVVTKDDDFRITHLLGKPPARLLHVTCGNTSTRDLLALFDESWSALEAAMGIYGYLGDQSSGRVHPRPELSSADEPSSGPSVIMPTNLGGQVVLGFDDVNRRAAATSRAS